MRVFIRCLALLIVISLSGCGGSGSGTPSSGSDARQTGTGGGYQLSGTLGGVDGTLLISDGQETVTLSKDGIFHFTQPLPKGSTFEISIKQAPDSQLCQIANAQGVITGTIDNIQITCATVRQYAADVSTPQAYAGKGLSMLSNFASVGVGEGTSLSVTSVPDSFVSLTTQDGKLVYLSLVTPKAKTLSINSKTTAFAVLMLDPVVASEAARQLVDLDALYNSVASFTSFSTLATEIDQEANSGSLDWSAPSATLLADIDAAKQDLLNAMAGLITATAKATASDVRSPTQSSITTFTPVDNVGLNYSVDTTHNKISFDVNNQSLRYLVGEFNGQNTVMLPPSSSKTVTLDLYQAFPGHQLALGLTGPGLSDSGQPPTEALVQSTVRTGWVQVAWPSLNTLLGIGAANGNGAASCIASNQQESAIQGMVTQLGSDSGFLSALGGNDYVTAFLDVQSRFDQTFRNTYLNQLFSCPSYNVGHLLGNSQDFMVRNIQGLMDLKAWLYSTKHSNSAYIRLNTASPLFEAINQTSAEVDWTLNDALAVTISGTPSQAGPAPLNLSLQAVCFNPQQSRSAVDCQVDWTVDGKAQGSGATLSMLLQNPGTYQIEATATNTLGARAMASRTITVSRPVATIAVEDGNHAAIANGSQVADFSASSPCDAPQSRQFFIANTGSTELDLSAITLTGNTANLTLTPPSSLTVPPGGTVSFAVNFVPSVFEANSDARIRIVSNSDSAPQFELDVTGQLPEPANYWLQTPIPGDDSVSCQLFTIADPAVVTGTGSDDRVLEANAANGLGVISLRFRNFAGNGSYSLAEQTENGVGTPGAIVAYNAPIQSFSTNAETGTNYSGTAQLRNADRGSDVTFQFNAVACNQISCLGGINAKAHFSGRIQWP